MCCAFIFLGVCAFIIFLPLMIYNASKFLNKVETTKQFKSLAVEIKSYDSNIKKVIFYSAIPISLDIDITIKEKKLDDYSKSKIFEQVREFIENKRPYIWKEFQKKHYPYNQDDPISSIHIRFEGKHFTYGYTYYYVKGEWEDSGYIASG